LTVIIRNIATLYVHRHEAAQAECDIQLLSEADIPDYQLRDVNDLFATHGWQSYYGQVVDIATKQGKRRGRRVLTAIRAPRDPVITLDADDVDRLFLIDTGRWVETTIILSDGAYFTVANVYGVSGASSKAEEFRQNEQIMAAALRRAAKMKDHPYLICGDCNTDPQNSKAIHKALQLRAFTTLGRSGPAREQSRSALIAKIQSNQEWKALARPEST